MRPSSAPSRLYPAPLQEIDDPAVPLGNFTEEEFKKGVNEGKNMSAQVMSFRLYSLSVLKFLTLEIPFISTVRRISILSIHVSCRE